VLTGRGIGRGGVVPAPATSLSGGARRSLMTGLMPRILRDSGSTGRFSEPRRCSCAGRSGAECNGTACPRRRREGVRRSRSGTAARVRAWRLRGRGEVRERARARLRRVGRGSRRGSKEGRAAGSWPEISALPVTRARNARRKVEILTCGARRSAGETGEAGVERARAVGVADGLRRAGRWAARGAGGGSVRAGPSAKAGRAKLGQVRDAGLGRAGEWRSGPESGLAEALAWVGFCLGPVLAGFWAFWVLGFLFPTLLLSKSNSNKV
jgi:hypothetical protein